MPKNQRPSIFRRKILIYPKFQLSLMAVNIVTMLAVFAAIQFQILSSVGEIQSMGEDSPVSTKQLYNRFIEYQMSVIYSGLVLYLGIGFILSCGFTLFISHRLAGPLVRMKHYFDEMEKSGKIDDSLKFRKGDFLQELPEAINRGLKSIQASSNSQTQNNKSEQDKL